MISLKFTNDTQIAKFGEVAFSVRHFPFKKVERNLESRWYIPKTQEKSRPIPMGNEHTRLKIHCEVYSQLHGSASDLISKLADMQQSQKSYLLTRTFNLKTLNDGAWVIESLHITGERFNKFGEAFKIMFTLQLLEYPSEEN